tara:strand:- start:10513 stop:11232 length:720 start_codon:yes stop_codon:yes gene_type:complete
MSLSLIIPVYNESAQIINTIKEIYKIKKKIKDFEILIVNDFSTDETVKVIKSANKSFKKIRLIQNKKKGLGSAMQTGILASKKKYVCIFMADLSDDINDVFKYFKTIDKNDFDAVFGTRFSSKSKIQKYPLFKFLLNRIFNNFVKLLFLNKYNDFTNAFKIYKRKTLIDIMPIISEHFNVFLEMPLKIISRKYSYTIIPINWKNRKRGNSKFIIKELGSMYLFTLLYCLLEKILLNYKK